MSNFYFVVGASGSGKTAVIPYLKELLQDIVIYDFDDIGIPENADKKWRQESTEKWIKKLLDEDRNACLLGQVVLGEILSCPSSKHINKINCCLLDVSDFERIQRLKKRNIHDAHQDMLNWSAWLRMHHRDPQWTPSVIKESSSDIMNFSRLDQIQNYNDVANLMTLDTTDFSLREVAEKIAHWIEEIETPGQNLSIPYTNYVLELNAENAFKIISYKLGEFNKTHVPIAQRPEIIDVNFIIKHSNEAIAGICGNIYMSVLHISLFFVEENYRNQGLGSILLGKIEEKVKQLGVTLTHLETFDFQAKDFYTKHGYEVFGVLDDCPKGHQLYYMKKIL